MTENKCRKCGRKDTNLYFDERCLDCWVKYGEDKISIKLKGGKQNEES